MQVLDELGPVSKKVQTECANANGGTGTNVRAGKILRNVKLIALLWFLN